MSISSEREQIVRELYAPYRIKYKRRRVEIRGLSDTIEADLADMSRLKTLNKNYCYFLLVVNPFSKFCYTRKLKTKQSLEVAKAMEEILIEAKLKFKNLWTDKGLH